MSAPRSTDEKTSKNSAKQLFWRQNDRYSSQNSNFWIQKLNFKPLLAILISNKKRLPGMGNVGGFHRRENSEKQRKTAKNSEKQRKTAKNSEKQRNGHFWRQE